MSTTEDKNRDYWLNLLKNTLGYAELQTEDERKAYVVGATTLFMKLSGDAESRIQDLTNELCREQARALEAKNDLILIATTLDKYRRPA